MNFTLVSAFSWFRSASIELISDSMWANFPFKFTLPPEDDAHELEDIDMAGLFIIDDWSWAYLNDSAYFVEYICWKLYNIYLFDQTIWYLFFQFNNLVNVNKRKYKQSFLTNKFPLTISSMFLRKFLKLRNLLLKNTFEIIIKCEYLSRSIYLLFLHILSPLYLFYNL